MLRTHATVIEEYILRGEDNKLEEYMDSNKQLEMFGSVEEIEVEYSYNQIEVLGCILVEVKGGIA